MSGDIRSRRFEVGPGGPRIGRRHPGRWLIPDRGCHRR